MAMLVVKFNDSNATAGAGNKSVLILEGCSGALQNFSVSRRNVCLFSSQKEPFGNQIFIQIILHHQHIRLSWKLDQKVCSSRQVCCILSRELVCLFIRTLCPVVCLVTGHSLASEGFKSAVEWSARWAVQLRTATTLEQSVLGKGIGAHNLLIL